ncbi:alanine dehydrogenase [Vibrio sp.]|uniref:Alanine dehydrogenase n=1 Tax=Vibrio viridaestus TaxID=2487322 RepID=A0A3N9TI80_9VIBR|nr:alanine dehydrogenase [Vibrio viridaestus]MDC0612412.1 alanine dehydrogenase [Vibrio sp.]RQW63235.1 alanine dehydrogenase [Vibrio viridaestus]
MIIGVPKEIKDHEYRVGLIPSSVRELTALGHQVLVESHAGYGTGFPDDEYIAAGASILPTADEVFSQAEMIVKVKEPQAVERAKLQKGQILFTYLHLAPDFPQTEELIKSKAICLAYETVTDYMGNLPLLAPMSEVAGRMSIQSGAYSLQKANGGRGLLLSGVPGVAPAHVVVIGGGIVGSNAARMAIGLKARVTILDNNINTLRKLDQEFSGRAEVIFSNKENIENNVMDADLLIGAVLIPGAQAPKLVNEALVKKMKPGSAIVDVAIDQGGCIETSHPTTHSDPIYIKHNVVHYCVANMPGAVARTSTIALNHATLPYVLSIANQGIALALKADEGLRAGVNVFEGHLTIKSVASQFSLPFTPLEEVLSIL